MKRYPPWRVIPWPANSKDWWAITRGNASVPYKAWLSRETAELAADILNIVREQSA